MLAVADDAAIATDIAALDAKWESDQAAYDQVAANNARQAIYTEVTDKADAAEEANNAIGRIDNTELGKKADEIKDAQKALADRIGEVRATAEATEAETDNLAALATLSKCITDIKSIKEEVDALEAEAARVQELVKANNSALDTANKEINKLKAQIVKDKNAVATNCGDVASDFDERFGELDKKVADLEANKDEAFGSETLADLWNNELEGTVENLTVESGKIVKDATAAQKNYTANQNMQSLYETILNTDIPTAKTDAREEDTEAGQKYYVESLIKGKEDKLAEYKKSIDKIYEDGKSAEKEGLAYLTADKKNGKLVDLQNEVKGVKALVKPNLNAYNDAKKEIAAVQALWDEVYFEISSKDQSDIVKDWLKELNLLKTGETNSISAFTDQVNGWYYAGEAKDRLGEAKTTATELKKKIEDVRTRQTDGYDNQIAKDNEARFNKFKTALAGVTDVYKYSVDQILLYKNVKYQSLKLEDPDLNEFLSEIPDYINRLREKVNKAYEDVQSPNLFDPELDYANEAAQYMNTISSRFDELVAKAKALYKAVWSGRAETVTADVDAAKQLIAERYANISETDAFKNAFKALADAVAQGNEYEQKHDIVNLDATLVYLESAAEVIAADKNAVAYQSFTTRLNALAGSVDSELQFLKDTGAGQSVIDNFEAYIENLNAVIAEKDAMGSVLNDNYTAMKAKVDALEQTRNQIQGSYVDNDKYYKLMTAGLTEIENRLDSVIGVTNGYYTFEQLYAGTNGIDKMSTSIESMTAMVKDWFENRMCAYTWAWDRFESWKETSNSNILNLLGMAWDNERAYLDECINTLVLEYSRYASAHTSEEEADAVKAMKERIDAVTEELAKVEKPAKPEELKPEVLIAIGNEIAAIRTELAAINDADLQAATLAALNGKVDALLAKATLDAYAESVQNKYKADMAEVVEEINAVKAAIAANANQAVYYNDKFTAALARAEENLNEVLANADRDQKVVETNDAAYVRLTAEIQVYRDAVQAEKDVIGAYMYANNYSGSFTLIDRRLAEIQTKLDERNNSQSLTVDTKIDDLYGGSEEFIASSLNDIRQNAAYSEAYGYWNANKTAYISIYNVLNSKQYSASVYEQLDKEREAISQANDELISAIKNEYDINRNGMADKLPEFVKSAEETKALIDALMKKITETTLGDADHSGAVNATDYYAVLKYVANPAELPEDITYIDINEDGMINIADAVGVANITLYGNIGGKAGAYKLKGSAVEEVAVKAVAQNGNTTRYAFSIDNFRAYTGAQMDIALPEGMTLAGCSLSNRAEAHDLLTGRSLEGNIRLVIGSATNQAFSGSEGDLLYIDVEGEGQIEVSNIIFAEPNMNTATFALSGGVTGIDGVEADKAGQDKAYNVGGRLMNGVKKGLNIIRNANGQFKKMLKK